MSASSKRISIFAYTNITTAITSFPQICTDEAYSVVEYKPDFRAMVVLVTHEVAHMMGVYHDESE